MPVHGRATDYRVKNKHKVNEEKWTSWTLVGKHVFNKLFDSMTSRPEMFQAPGHETPPPLWRITAKNAAWLAADIASRGERHLLKDLTPKAKD